MANQLFDARGFWASSLEDVCLEAGLDVDVVTRIYPNLYTLFREFMLDTANALLAATEVGTVETRDSRQARACLRATIESLAAAYLTRRGSGAGFIRGEHRYLDDEDMQELRRAYSLIRDRIATLVTRARPGIADTDAKLLAAAACSTLSSIITQPSELPEPKLRTMLTVSATRLVESESAIAAPTGTFRPRQSPAWLDTESTKGRLVADSISLLYRRGLAATLEDVALEAGIPIETARHELGSMTDVLSGAFEMSTDSLRAGISDAAAAAGPRPRDILAAMTHAFVEHSFSDPELGMVFVYDSHRLPSPHAERAGALHDEFMDAWLGCLLSIRPELAPAEASFLINAGHQIVADIGSQMDWEYDDEAMAKIERLVVASLIGGR